MNKINIACVTYKKLASLMNNAKNMIKDNSINIDIIETDMQSLNKNLKESMLKNNIDVFIAGSAYAEIIQTTIKKPVVKIQLTTLDYLKAFSKAQKFGKRVGLASFESLPNIDFKEFETIMNIEIVNIIYNDSFDFKKKLLASNIDCLVGASVSNDIASNNDIPSVLIYKGKESVISAVEEAKRLILASYEEKRKADTYESILNFNPSGILITDEFGKIIVFNPSAEEIFNRQYENVIGKTVEEIFPELKIDEIYRKEKNQIETILPLENRSILLKALSIERDDDLIGILITAVIQKKGNYLNKFSNQNRGFKAKNTFSNIIGSSISIKQPINKSKKYARSNSSILLYGETGSGKEMFAQSIHNYSYRYNKPFIGINCATLPENLLESELFGYTEGAFTGSKKGGKKGLFELADGGTIFLDEIAEIPLKLQARLLRVIQEKEIIPIGGESVIPINVRIIAATNKNLQELIPVNFREDLYYRLNVLQVDVPPLRRRDEDILELFQYYFEKSIIRNNKKSIKISNNHLDILKKYSWPGNIRQLINTVERFVLEIDSLYDMNQKNINKLFISSIGEENLLNDIIKKHNINSEEIGNLNSKQIKKDLIQDLLDIYPKQREKVSEILGISRTTLWRILS